jgi:hypothetical protein
VSGIRDFVVMKNKTTFVYREDDYCRVTETVCTCDGCKAKEGDPCWWLIRHKDMEKEK